MKLKEINRTSIQSWSPAQQHPIYLATGTSAQQLDASFSTNASLEFFELDLAEPSLDMKSCGSLATAHRYHKLVWGPYGMENHSHPSGVLIAGGENGNVILYNPAKIMAGKSDVVIAESDRHTGPVRALDVNPFQTNLFASGGNESEIYIWDMNNFGSPMTPGPKTQPVEDISCVAWNRQVQHILASASPSGRASVWDLRKNDLIIKVSDHSNRMHCSGLAWNPEVATQLVLSSEDDRMPVIQMWDLRFATSPLKILENHTRGILAIAWSLADPELLLSCGKDNRILCWNPNTAEVLYELPTSSQWCFDILWCPRNPAVLSAASFDGHIDIYSIMGGSSQAQSQKQADQISNSFGNMDPFGTGQTLPLLQLPQTTAPPATVNPLKKPPKWIRRPVGASFAFGGKLVSLENAKPKPQQPPSHVVHVSQVVTETAFLKRSDQLQAMLNAESFVEFCKEKVAGAENEFEKTVWSFLKANFESDVRSKFLELLGYNKEELALKISAALEEKPAEPPKVPPAPAATSVQPEPPADFSFLPPTDSPEAAFDMIAAANLQTATMLELDSSPAAADLVAADLVAADLVAADLVAADLVAADLVPADLVAAGLVQEDPAAADLVSAGLVPEDPAAADLVAAGLVSEDPAAADLVAAGLVSEDPAAADLVAAGLLSEDPAAADLVAAGLLSKDPAAADLVAAGLVSEDPAAVDPVEALIGEPHLDQAPLEEEKVVEVEEQEIPLEEVDLPPAAIIQPEPPADFSFLPPTDTPEAAFDMIAAANLQPAATLELDSSPDPNPEEPDAAQPAAADPVEALTSEPEAHVDQVLPEKQKEEEEVSLVEEAPAEEDLGAAAEESSEAAAAGPAGVSLSISQDVDGLITQALLTGDFEGAVELCLHDNRMADSIILAIAGGTELLEKTQKKYFTKTHSKITKLISAVVMKDWYDILKTCELQNWKEALAAVMTYAQPEEFSSLCDLLGARLEAAGEAELQAQACLCYICAGNVEKLVSCWTRAQDAHCPLSLQDLVEKVVVMRRAVELTQRSGPAAIGLLLAEKMSQYAGLLASQGSLATAITYLPDNTNQVAVQQLRDRLSCALGQQQQQQAAAVAAITPVPVQTQRAAQSQPSAPRPQHGSALPQHPFTPVQPPAMVPHPAAPMPAAMPPPAAAPAQPQYYQPVRAASTVTSWSNQTPTALPNAPPPLQVGSVSDQQQVEPSNPMYGLPASGPAAVVPASTAPAYMYSHQYQPYHQVNQFPPGPGATPPLYQPVHFSATVPHAEPPGFMSHYTQPVLPQPAPPLYPGQPPASQCLSSSPPSHPPFFPTASSSSSSSSSSCSFPAPLSSGASFQHGGPGSPVSYMPLPPPCRVSGPQNGWNDPPALSRASKKKQTPVQYTPPAPITAPIMASLGADSHAQPASSGVPQAPQTGVQGPHGVQAPYSGMHQQLPPPPMNPAMPKTSMEGAPGAPTGDVIQPLQSIPAEKITKKPIPDEHLVLKTTFEGLIQKCLAVATDPQTKRKLDDANKRLEALYDKLREQTLSPSIVGGLHSMARSVESRSYQEGINIHTHIVSSSNFSETSAFMPVLKVVLTQANKLGV